MKPENAPKPDYLNIPDEFPPVWSMAYGQDDYGYWADFQIKAVIQRMRWIPAGWFLMGSPKDEKERFDNETQYGVLLTEGYWLADTACTQGLWAAVMGDNPAHFQDDLQNPVEQVSWDDIQLFFEEINSSHSVLKLSLPTEAQWEFACRAGTASSFSFGEELTTDKANYNGKWTYSDDKVVGEYREKTIQVKSFAANPWGLYQMHGNVWEWCQDWHGEYPSGQVQNPQGKESGGDRVLRGGSWIDLGLRVRSAYRDRLTPVSRYDSFGFRLSQVKSS